MFHRIRSVEKFLPLTFASSLVVSQRLQDIYLQTSKAAQVVIAGSAQILLENGMYRCAECNFTTAKLAVVKNHRQVGETNHALGETARCGPVFSRISISLEYLMTHQ